MTPTEIINALRNIADVYEEVGVDHLQRAVIVMREAADTIETLQAQLEQANKRIETKETLLRLQETTISMLSSDKDMLIHKLRDAESNLAASQRRAQDARNELCQKCGRYREAHNGACDGCRWKENSRGN